MTTKIFIGYPQPKDVDLFLPGMMSITKEGKSYLGIYLDTSRIAVADLRREIRTIASLFMMDEQSSVLFGEFFLG